MKTDIIKTAAAIADLLREEPSVARELKNHFDGEQELEKILGLDGEVVNNQSPHTLIELALTNIVSSRKS